SSSSCSSAWPASMTSPLLGRSSPARRPSSVDLPEPELPTMARLSPALRSRDRLCRMVRSPSALGTTLLRLRALRMQVFMEIPMRAWCIAGAMAVLLWSQNSLAGTLLVVGDSISAALGMDTRQGWVALLEQRLGEEGLDHRVVNASISGDTTAGGLVRLPRLLAEHQPEWVILELGGNDGLRGLPPAQMQQNLLAM